MGNTKNSITPWLFADPTSAIPKNQTKQVEIMVVGGGFGGIKTVQNLAGSGARIWLVDKRSTFAR
jgi:glycerol-3-phosphate dehydrogenase